MFTIVKTERFDKWLDKLKDRHAKIRILDRINGMIGGI